MSATLAAHPPAARSTNGFFLTSALCMLAGCYLVSGASSSAPHDVIRLLPILGWLNLYELLLIGLAAFLTRRGLVRDARLLLVLAAVFLADAAQLTGEAVTASGERWPAAVAGLGLLLAGKIYLVAALFRVTLASFSLLRLIPSAALLLVMPGLLSAIARTGMAPDLPLYGLAWVIGLLLMFEIVAPVAAAPADATLGAARTFARALRVALLASLCVHLWAGHWMYDARVYVCSLSPLVLALALRYTRRQDIGESGDKRAALPAMAVLLAMPWPDVLAVGVFGATLSPLRLTLLVAALVYLYDYSRHRQRLFIAGAAACACPALIGDSVSAIANTIADGLGAMFRTGAGLSRFNTRRIWGGAAVVAAYLLLWLGARSSLRGADPRATKVGP